MTESNKKRIALHFEIAQDVLANERDFSSDEFQSLSRQRGFNPDAPSGACRSLKENGFIKCVGRKPGNRQRGHAAVVYRLIPSMKDALLREIDLAQYRIKTVGKRKKMESVVVNIEYARKLCFDRIQAWLDGITRDRLVTTNKEKTVETTGP